LTVKTQGPFARRARQGVWWKWMEEACNPACPAIRKELKGTATPKAESLQAIAW